MSEKPATNHQVNLADRHLRAAAPGSTFPIARDLSLALIARIRQEQAENERLRETLQQHETAIKAFLPHDCERWHACEACLAALRAFQSLRDDE